jgi:hypothetical protein
MHRLQLKRPTGNENTNFRESCDHRKRCAGNLRRSVPLQTMSRILDDDPTTSYDGSTKSMLSIGCWTHNRE